MHDPTLLLRRRPADVTPEWVAPPTGEASSTAHPPPWLAPAAAPIAAGEDATLILRAGRRGAGPRLRLVACAADLVDRLAPHPAWADALGPTRGRTTTSLHRSIEGALAATPGADADAIVAAALDRGPSDAPHVAVVAGTLELQLDPRARLRANLQALLHLLVDRPGAGQVVADAKALLKAPRLEAPTAFEQIEALWAAAGPQARDLRARLDPQVDRALVVRRAFVRARAFGRELQRGTWTFEGHGDPLDLFWEPALFADVCTPLRVTCRALVAFDRVDGPSAGSRVGGEVLALATARR